MFKIILTYCVFKNNRVGGSYHYLKRLQEALRVDVDWNANATIFRIVADGMFGNGLMGENP